MRAVLRRRHRAAESAPGRDVRLLLLGYFEGLDSERAIAWRAADSLSIRQFLLGTWRQQREAGLMPKTRGRKPTAVDPQLKKLEQENRRLTSRLRRAEALLAFQKKVSELLQIPLKPFVSDGDD